MSHPSCRIAPALAGGIIALGLAAAPAFASGVLINEIRVDQPSGDEDEYFELIGPAGQLLDGFTYLVIGDGTGGSGTIEAVVDLTGQVIPASGFFVAAEASFTLGTADFTTSLPFENSDNVTHLLVEGFSGANGDDLDADDDCTLDSTPWTIEHDRIALLEEDNPAAGTECHYGPPSVGPNGPFVPGHVFRCGPNNAWAIGVFDEADPNANDTPGAANDPCPCDNVVFHLSARVLGTPNANEVFLADGAGTVTGSYAQITGAREDAWGYRDGAYDGDGVYFGWAGGLARHDGDGANGALVCPNNTTNTTIRALAYDPRSGGSFWTADFGSQLVEFDPVTCMNIQVFPNSMTDPWSLYGLAYDEFDGNLWAHTTGGAVIKIDTSTGAVIAGEGWPTGFANLAAQGGLSGYSVLSFNARDVAALSQGTPDELGAYDSTTGTLVLGPVDVEVQSGTNGHLGVAVACGASGPPACGQCDGDLNNDGLVNVFDLLLVLDNWGVPTDPCADTNGDGTVNVFDLLFVLDNWGPCI